MYIYAFDLCNVKFYMCIYVYSMYMYIMRIYVCIYVISIRRPGFPYRLSFFIGPLPCSEGFSLVPPVFHPPQKNNILKSNPTWK